MKICQESVMPQSNEMLGKKVKVPGTSHANLSRYAGFPHSL
jgi:hypothetical protein